MSLCKKRRQTEVTTLRFSDQWGRKGEISSVNNCWFNHLLSSTGAVTAVCSRPVAYHFGGKGRQESVRECMCVCMCVGPCLHSAFLSFPFIWYKCPLSQLLDFEDLMCCKVILLSALTKSDHDAPRNLLWFSCVMFLRWPFFNIPSCQSSSDSCKTATVLAAL